MDLTNIANSYKKLCKENFNEIQPKKEDYKDYKYLVAEKGTGKIPKKDIILARENVGRVILLFDKEEDGLTNLFKISNTEKRTGQKI